MFALNPNIKLYGQLRVCLSASKAPVALYLLAAQKMHEKLKKIVLYDQELRPSIKAEQTQTFGSSPKGPQIQGCRKTFTSQTSLFTEYVDKQVDSA